MPEITFEPIGETIDCGEDETVLDAAFRQGYSLVHGCREGQCSACKAYLLEGEVTLKKYSTFALSESEEEQGYTLLCRAMPDDDEVVVELLHYDEEDFRSSYPIERHTATVESISDLTHDISSLVINSQSFDFRPGHYVDVHVGDSDRRSFSAANLPGDGRLELIIKRYPGGVFSGMIDAGEVKAGDPIGFTGPYGALRLRDGERMILLAAGGSGMAPVLAILRQLARDGDPRPVRFLFGARTRADLFLGEEIAALGSTLADFEFVEVLSEPTDDCAWEGETGLLHEALARLIDERDLDAYVCGPPPMVEAVCDQLEGLGVEENQIHYDKFTTAASAEGAV